jgi:hypothetical protein
MNTAMASVGWMATLLLSASGVPLPDPLQARTQTLVCEASLYVNNTSSPFVADVVHWTLVPDVEADMGLPIAALPAVAQLGAADMGWGLLA